MQPHELQNALAGTRLFTHLSDQQLTYLLDGAEVQTVEPGTMLIEEDDLSWDYLVLLDGELSVWVQPDGAGEALLVGNVFPGQGVGEVALVHQVTRRATVRATKRSRYLRLDGRRMEELLAWSQEFRNALLGDANLRIRMNRIRQTEIFRKLPLANVKAAFEAMVPHQVGEGDVIVREGEHGDQYYVVEEGRALVHKTRKGKSEPEMVGVLNPGDTFGAEALLSDGLRTATVTMFTNGRLLSLSRGIFDTLIRPLSINTITAQQAQEKVAAGQARFLDCRCEDEFRCGHIPGALSVPLDELRERMADLKGDQPWIVYCGSGRRAACATFALAEKGISAFQLEGGLRNWPFAVVAEPAAPT